jgi:hypothetical protein
MLDSSRSIAAAEITSVLCLARIRFAGGGNDEAGSRRARWDALKCAPYIWERSANKGGLVRWSWNGFRGDDSIRGVR